MKKLLLLILFTGIVYSQSKKELLSQIYDYRKSIVDTVSYNNEESEMWNAMYLISKEEYSTITKESERKGYIEAKDEKELYIEHFTAEIIGKGPFKVSFQVTKQEKREKNSDGTYTPWTSYVSNTLNSYYLKLQVRLYELLRGKIILPDDLSKKIETYNNSQKKDKNKIIKGVDY